MNDALFFRGNLQRAEEPLDVLQSELDSETLRSVKPGERLLVIQTRTRCHIHRAAAK